MKSFEDFLKEHPNLTIHKLENTTVVNQKPESIAIKQEQKGKKTTKPIEFAPSQKIQKLEEWDKVKTKVLKYVVYKKRTEAEIRQKFSSSVDENLLEDIIQDLKQNHYINDENYIQRAVSEFMAIHTLSRKEIRNKLYAKGINRDIISSYFEAHEEELEEYEINCAKKIFLKKRNQMDEEKIEQFLYKKGYTSETIKITLEEMTK